MNPVVRLAEKTDLELGHERATFDRVLIRLPRQWLQEDSRPVDDLYTACAAHLGAHLAYGKGKYQLGSLRPLQMTLVSLLEDARVEHLAGRDYPGLLRLWRSFHKVTAQGPLLTESLMARLSRGLLDPNYQDDNTWVKKGRGLFARLLENDGDAAEYRRAGVLLGNDLGQMRLQFDPKSYLVEPAYRDDHMGLWDLPLPEDQAEGQEDLVLESVRLRRPQSDDEPIQRHRKQTEVGDSSIAVKFEEVDANAGMPLAHYSEWDYRTAQERYNWATVVQYEPDRSPASIIDFVLSKYEAEMNQIDALVGQARIGRPVRLKRQTDGDRLDLDACVRAAIDRRAGLLPDPRVHETTARLHRDMAILVLLDISESTKDLIGGTTRSVFSMVRASACLLAHALTKVGDPFALEAFCSDGCKDVRIYPIKGFDEAYGEKQKARMAGLKPGLSTRMGVALRHAGAEISVQKNYRRLVFVLSDGIPSDVDEDDSRYFVEDARMAVSGLRQQGIDVFCLCLSGGEGDVISQIFGSRNSALIDDVMTLPQQLPTLFFKLST